MTTAIYQRLSFEVLNQILWSAVWDDFVFDQKALRKHGTWGLPTVLGKEIDVARKAAGNAARRGNKDGVTWTNVPITPEHEVELSRGQFEDALILAGVLECVRAGYTFGFKPTADGEGYMAYFIAPHKDSANSGLGLAAFAGNERDAIMCLVFKHYHITDEVWPRDGSTEGGRFR